MSENKTIIDSIKNCRDCPRECGADRSSGTGACGVGALPRVARAALHFWEEPCISGTRGSGTVFFSGCALRCVFCQNREIALAQRGTEVSRERLTEIFLELQKQGANNINLVTPSHNTDIICEALRHAKEKGLTVPIVYNTGSYEKAETLRRLEGLVDIWLPDLKYYDTELSARYSAAPDYFSVAAKAIKEMYRQAGPAQFGGIEPENEQKQNDGPEQAGEQGQSCGPEQAGEQGQSCGPEQAGEQGQSCGPEQADEQGQSCGPEQADEPEQAGKQEQGLMKRGIIVRHLVLPGHVADSKKILRYLYETYGDHIYISIMNQYTPMLTGAPAEKYPELTHKVKQSEYNRVVDYAIRLGVSNAFIQEGGTAKESFIPDFDGTGVNI